MEESVKKDLEKAAKILKEFGAKEVYLFGSQAVGNAGKYSDLDLAVSGIPPEKFYEAGGEVMFAVSLPVHIIDLDFPNDFTEYLRANGELRSVG